MLCSLQAKKVVDCNYEESENIFEMQIKYQNISFCEFKLSSSNLIGCFAGS